MLTGDADRVRRAAGRSYPDLVRLRAGQLGEAPDAVIVPLLAEAVEALLAACAEADVAVVPFGGGSSVVGGLDAVDGGHSAVVSLDMTALRAVDLDRTSLTARLGPGPARPRGRGGPRRPRAHDRPLPAVLRAGDDRRHGGHPISRPGLERLRALRRAGHGPGADDPFGHAAGPSRRPIRRPDRPCASWCWARRARSVSSPKSTCRVRPVPEERRYEGWMAEDWVAGREIVREMAQHGEEPDVLRLSDEEETRVSLQLSGTEGLQKKGLDAYLALRRRSEGCLVICGWEGEHESVRRRSSLGHRRLRAGGAVPLGQAAGRSWEKGRFEGPYLRDELLGHGRLRRDPRDLPHLEPPRRALRRRRRSPQGHTRPAVDRDVPPLARLPRRRLALLHLPRALPRRRPRRPDRPVAAKPRPPPAMRSSPPRERSPTTTPSGATTPPT